MIVQSIDRKWYIDPVFESEKRIVECREDNVTLYRKGPIVSWPTAVKGLKGFGLQVGFLHGPYADSTIFIDEMADCCRYQVKFTGPIPTPHRHSGVLSEEPNLTETSEHRLIKWPRSRLL